MMKGKSPSLETFIPAHDFCGYPQGVKVDFRAGVESIPVPAEFAKMCRDVGHVVPEKTVADHD